MMDQKSICYVWGKHKDADALACDCVGFANATGGAILLGIEDDQTEPPASQRVPDDLPERLTKRIPQITTNVTSLARKMTATNGGEYIEIQVARSAQGIAATTDGRYFIRVADETRRLMPDELSRLLTERNTMAWELLTSQRVPCDRLDVTKLKTFGDLIRASDRVSSFIKGKAEGELRYSIICLCVTRI